MSRCLVFVAVGGLLTPACNQPTPLAATAGAPASYPAAEGFDSAGSDAQAVAVAVADRVMRAMGGYDNWQQARYFA